MPSASRVRIWDLPTRLFHWLFAASVIGAFVSVKVGGLWMDYHLLFGYAALGLLIFRVLWGFVGPRYVRFSQFIKGPAAILRYLREPRRMAGHNPLGGWSVLALLLAVGVQVSTGLFASDGIFTEGPLASRISGELSDQLTSIHHSNEIVIMILVGLHLLAIVFYGLFKRQNLTGPMITGSAPADAFDTPQADAECSVGLAIKAIICAAIAAAVVAWVVA